MLVRYISVRCVTSSWQVLASALLLQVFDRDGLVTKHEIGRVSLSLERLRFEDRVEFAETLNTQVTASSVSRRGNGQVTEGVSTRAGNGQ